jgi:hypothetical protein
MLQEENKRATQNQLEQALCKTSLISASICQIFPIITPLYLSTRTRLLSILTTRPTDAPVGEIRLEVGLPHFRCFLLVAVVET